ncbi:ATPase, partial [filamentous cyanobacterium CCP5]
MRKLTGGAALAVAGVVAMQNFSSPEPEPSPAVTVHLFEWTWADVAQECETQLGPGGFKAVQVSPPQEHIVMPEKGYPWWQRYQPVSYQLTSRSGDRAAFIDMVERCDRAGVAVYVDAVINHMAGIEGGVGSGGTAFSKYDYPGLYSPEDFNDCRQPIKDYKDAQDVTQCELVGLSDLKTDSEYVQTQIVGYLSELVGLGVKGFRIDAAKHIRAAELGEIVARLKSATEIDPYIYQEVIDPGNEAVRKQDYYPNGDVIEFEFGRAVGEAFLGINDRSLADLATLGESWGLAPSDQAVVFIDNHDKQRGHGGGGTYLTHKDTDLYTLANVFMLAYPYGEVRVMSSYAFEDSDQGPPADAAGHTLPVYSKVGDGPSGPVFDHRCGQEWVCEHRWPEIASMVR